jgi:hypothetical protein
MAYKGRYQPSYPKKYKGNPTNIIYRSLWERRFMNYCDKNKNILEWGSEEISLPYRSPLDGKIHRYFPDFYVKIRENNGSVQKYIIEVKPKKQTIEPKVQRKKTKGYIFEVTEWARNQAKWKVAEEYCDDRRWKFKIITEDELGIN